MRNLLVIFILVCSAFFWPGKELRIAQEIFYQIAGMGLFVSLLFYGMKPIRPNKVNLWFGIFGLYACVNFLLGGASTGASTLLNIMVAMMLYFVTLQIAKDDTMFILKAVVWVCIVNIFYLALQGINMDIIYHIRGPNNTISYGTIDFVGLFGLKAVMGMWMGLGLISTLALSPLLSLAFLVPIYLSKSSGVILGLSAAVPFYYYYVDRRLFKLITPVLLIGGLCYIIFVDSPMGMMGTRPPQWKLVCKDTFVPLSIKGNSPFVGNPLLGHGLDSFRAGPIGYFKRTDTDETVRALKTNKGVTDFQGRPYLRINGRVCAPDGVPVDYWDNTHNEVIQLLYEMGIIGVVIVSFLFYALYKLFRQTVKSDQLVLVSALIVFLLGCSVAQFPFHLARIGYLLPILLALFVKNCEGEYATETNTFR